MNHQEVGNYWNKNADVWTLLSRQGYDVYRDSFNTPAFMAMLPDIQNQKGIDIGCGEGANTRLLAHRGAHMTGVDIAERFIEQAEEHEQKEPLGITYRLASAVELPFEDASFEFATSFMCMMDIPETSSVLQEIFRVIQPGGFLQFSITHPCFDTPHRKNLRNEHGLTYAIEVGRYFHNKDGELSEWIFDAAPEELLKGLRKFQIPCFTHTISQWLNLLIDTGFMIERIEEPKPSDETVRQYPKVQDAQIVAYFLHIRVRKP